MLFITANSARGEPRITLPLVPLTAALALSTQPFLSLTPRSVLVPASCVHTGSESPGTGAPYFANPVHAAASADALPRSSSSTATTLNFEPTGSAPKVQSGPA